MCFLTDGVLHHWHGRRAWREWRVSRRGWLLSPLYETDDDPWYSEFAVCNRLLKPTTMMGDAFAGRPCAAVGLYAHASICAIDVFNAEAWGTVHCFGSGYKAVRHDGLTAESMVIERIWIHPRVSSELFAKLRTHYPFVDFQRSTPC